MTEKPRLWEGFSYWPSYTDVMVVTLMIFLFFLFAQMTFSSEALRAGKMIANQRLIAEEVEKTLGSDRSMMTIVTDGNLQRFQFSDRILFDRGEAELLPRGREVLARVGGVLVARRDLFETVQVEGHTDVRPIRTVMFPSNWELSSARATSVVRFLQDSLNFDPARLSANGFSQYRPAAAGDSEDALARNRRVELVVVYSVKKSGAARASAAVP
jgi:flagellar motor protein MotB